MIQCHQLFHKATGSDGLPTQFIRASPHMVRLITVLLNKCIDKVPYQWKQAVVTHVPKCKQCSGLLQFHLVQSLRTDYIQSNCFTFNLLSVHQSACFHAGFSTHDVLQHVTDK